MSNPLERAAALAGLDDTEKAKFFTAYDQPQDLAMLEAEDRVEVFGDEFPVHKRRRLLNIKKYVQHGNALDKMTSMQTMVNAVARIDAPAAAPPATAAQNGTAAARESFLEAVRSVVLNAN